MGAHEYLRFIASLAVVLALMGLLAYALKRAGLGDGAPSLPGRKKRLGIVETKAIDPRHRLALIRRDDREHLVILGPQGQTVIEAGIPAPKDQNQDPPAP